MCLRYNRMEDVIVEALFKLLYQLYVQEILDLNIGNAFNKERIDKMTDIVNALCYIQNKQVSNKDVIKIIQHYDEM